MKGNLQHRSLSNTTELYSHTQPSPGWPGLHQDPRPLEYGSPLCSKKSSQQKQTTLLWSTVAVKFDSAFIKLCVCVKKSNFLSWAIRTVFVDPVTIMDFSPFCNFYNIFEQVVGPGPIYTEYKHTSSAL